MVAFVQDDLVSTTPLYVQEAALSNGFILLREKRATSCCQTAMSGLYLTQLEEVGNILATNVAAPGRAGCGPT